MALIKCPECGKDVSDTIESCIHCGYRLRKNEVVTDSLSEQNNDANIQIEKTNNTDLEQNEQESFVPGEGENGCLKFLIAVVCSVVVIALLIFIFSSSIKCGNCDDGFVVCENCTEGKVVCDDCEGKITVVCENCNDEGLAKCSICNGSGEGKSYSKKCFTCGGNGKIRLDCKNCGGTGMTYTPRGFVECMQCNGSGYASPVKCPVCGGDGIATGYEDCEACNGSRFGEEVCAKCKGTKEAKCEKCSATGNAECPACDGTKTIPCEKCNSDYKNSTSKQNQ